MDYEEEIGPFERDYYLLLTGIELAEKALNKAWEAIDKSESNKAGFPKKKAKHGISSALGVLRQGKELVEDARRGAP